MTSNLIFPSTSIETNNNPEELTKVIKGLSLGQSMFFTVNPKVASNPYWSIGDNTDIYGDYLDLAYLPKVSIFGFSPGVYTLEYSIGAISRDNGISWFVGDFIASNLRPDMTGDWNKTLGPNVGLSTQPSAAAAEAYAHSLPINIQSFTLTSAHCSANFALRFWHQWIGSDFSTLTGYITYKLTYATSAIVTTTTQPPIVTTTTQPPIVTTTTQPPKECSAYVTYFGVPNKKNIINVHYKDLALLGGFPFTDKMIIKVTRYSSNGMIQLVYTLNIPYNQASGVFECLTVDLESNPCIGLELIYVPGGYIPVGQLMIDACSLVCPTTMLTLDAVLNCFGNTTGEASVLNPPYDKAIAINFPATGTYRFEYISGAVSWWPSDASQGWKTGSLIYSNINLGIPLGPVIDWLPTDTEAQAAALAAPHIFDLQVTAGKHVFWIFDLCDCCADNRGTVVYKITNMTGLGDCSSIQTTTTVPPCPDFFITLDGVSNCYGDSSGAASKLVSPGTPKAISVHFPVTGQYMLEYISGAVSWWSTDASQGWSTGLVFSDIFSYLGIGYSIAPDLGWFPTAAAAEAAALAVEHASWYNIPAGDHFFWIHDDCDCCADNRGSITLKITPNFAANCVSPGGLQTTTPPLITTTPPLTTTTTTTTPAPPDPPDMLFLVGNRMRTAPTGWHETIDVSRLYADTDYVLTIWFEPVPVSAYLTGTITVPGGVFPFQSPYDIGTYDGLGGQHFPFNGKLGGVRIDIDIMYGQAVRGQFIISPGYVENFYS